jgi:hypothetical protein
VSDETCRLPKRGELFINPLGDSSRRAESDLGFCAHKAMNICRVVLTQFEDLQARVPTQ